MRRVQSNLVLSVVFLAAGTILTLENMGIISGASRLWPIFVLVLGAGFCILFFERKPLDLVLLWLGSMLSQCGIFFLYLNFTSWHQMAKLWPVFLGIAGMSFFVLYIRARNRIFLSVALGLVVLAAVFFLVFGVSLALWPLSLVAFGASLLFVNYYYLKK
ncbi:MAG: hypothetical protein MUF22_01985 [Chitinispirillaceae bacterium]|jgi:hypothetical protein|nr:hypothetical protein [Chitinispirillaceae bacterium]